MYHIFRTAGAVILRISHGYEVQEHKDPFVTLANTATEQFSLATSTGQFMVDCIPARESLLFSFPPSLILSLTSSFSCSTSYITSYPVSVTTSMNPNSPYPIVKHVPDWMPGADFKKKAKDWAATLNELVEQPHNFVKQQIVRRLL